MKQLSLPTLQVDKMSDYRYRCVSNWNSKPTPFSSTRHLSFVGYANVIVKSWFYCGSDCSSDSKWSCMEIESPRTQVPITERSCYGEEIYYAFIFNLAYLSKNCWKSDTVAKPTIVVRLTFRDDFLWDSLRYLFLFVWHKTLSYIHICKKDWGIVLS